MRIFHIRNGKYARAFAVDYTWLQSIALWLRGWRKDLFFVSDAYTKPSRNQKALESRNK